MLRKLSAAALLCFLPTAPAADPVSLLPQDTLLCVSVAKPERLSALAEHPVSRAVKMGRLKELLGRTFENLGDGDAAKVWREECGLTPGEVLAKFSGSMAFGIFDAKLNDEREEEEQPVEMGLAAAFDGDDKLFAGVLRALAKIEAGEDGTGEDASELGQLLQAEEMTEEVDGVTIHQQKSEALAEASLDSLAWCVRDKMLLAATGEKQLRAMLERAAAGKTEGTFASSGTWKAAREGTSDSDILLAFDFAQLMRLAIGDTGGAAFTSISTGLDLNRIKVLALGLRHDEQAIEIKVHVPCDGLPWFFDYLKRAPGAEAPKFFPAKLTSASWLPVDFGALAEGVLEKVPDVFPPAKAQLDAGLAALKTAAGVDLEKEILAQLGTGYFQVTHAVEQVTGKELAEAPDVGNFFNITVPEKEGAVLGLRLKDAKVVDSALRSLAEKMLRGKVDLDAREYMGWKIHLLKTPPRPAADEDDEEGSPFRGVPVSLTVADDWMLLAVGRQEVLESVLAGMKNPPADHFWARPDIQKGLDAMPGGENYASFEDLSQTGPAALAALSGVLAFIPGVDPVEIVGKMDELSATIETPLHVFGKYHSDRDSFSSTSRIVVSPAAK
jgi:hypothetical protein